MAAPHQIAIPAGAAAAGGVRPCCASMRLDSGRWWSGAGRARLPCVWWQSQPAPNPGCRAWAPCRICPSEPCALSIEPAGRP